jgi:hypothetical protein
MFGEYPLLPSCCSTGQATTDSREYERVSAKYWVRVPINSILRLDRAERQKTSSTGRLVSCAIFGKQTSEQSGTQLPKIESFPQQRKRYAVREDHRPESRYKHRALDSQVKTSLNARRLLLIRLFQQATIACG